MAGTLQLALLPAAAALSFIGAQWYHRHASVHGPYAVPNHRSSHQKVIPRGGGIVAAFAFLSLLGVYQIFSDKKLPHALYYLIGGAAMAVAGAVDDRVELKPGWRLLIQIAACASLPLLLRPEGESTSPFFKWATFLPLLPITILLLVWFYNLYNFIDGTDGMAGMGTIFICAVMGALLLRAGHADLAFVLWLLAASNVGFMALNWPPAKMFMGDSGTTFITWILAAAIWISATRDLHLLWVWLTACAVYIADTTTTTTTRLLTVKGWYKAHRSHAYQNLARVWSHRRILKWVLILDCAWALPCACIVALRPDWALPVMVLCYIPLVALSMKYGPRFQNT